MLHRKILWIAEFNPEPWTVPSPGIGRKGGKVFPYLVKDQRVKDYQEGIRVNVQNAYTIEMFDPEQPLILEMFMWRKLDEYETTRKTQRHVADATNCGKALEDALQGILFKNDRQVTSSMPTIIEQRATTEPLIIVVASPWLSESPIPTSDFRKLQDEWNGEPAVQYREEPMFPNAPANQLQHPATGLQA